MGLLVDIKKAAKEREKRKLDAQASHTELVKCLKILQMNNIPELRSIKLAMRRAIRNMALIGNEKKGT